MLVSLIIFDFSSQTYHEQTLVPSLEKWILGEPLKGPLSHISFSYGGSEVSIAAKGYYYFIEFFIRKFAHFSIYFILSFLVFSALSYLLKKRRSAILWTAFFIVLYASSDEIHQAFTGDRTPMVRDVVIDFIGGMMAIVLTLIFKRKRK
ncbi:VanZ family protein [Cytobacillus sp. Hz8]|uniref:VanZ family protein n=1 Tax=Cytobacillus sp. Hz8 TaxID=3347168 RepID=UPI0035E2B557